MKQILAFLHGRHAEAVDAARLAEPMLGAARATPIEATHHFYHALTLTALYPSAPMNEQAQVATLLEGKLARLKLWAHNCPQNYYNRYALVLAEIARIEGRPAEAMDLYEEAIRSAHSNKVTVALRRASVTAADLPEALFRYVLRTHESVLLHDASAQGPFSGDSYVREHRARSALCLPLLKQTRIVGVLYLENNLTPHVFTPARMAVLKLLASEAATSLENTRLYGDSKSARHA